MGLLSSLLIISRNFKIPVDFWAFVCYTVVVVGKMDKCSPLIELEYAPCLPANVRGNSHPSVSRDHDRQGALYIGGYLYV